MGQTGGSVSAPCVSGLSPEGTITLPYLSQDTNVCSCCDYMPAPRPSPTASTTARLVAVLG